MPARSSALATEQSIALFKTGKLLTIMPILTNLLNEFVKSNYGTGKTRKKRRREIA